MSVAFWIVVVVEACNEYSVIMARAEVLRKKILATYKAYLIVGGQTIKQVEKVGLIAPAFEIHLIEAARPESTMSIPAPIKPDALPEAPAPAKPAAKRGVPVRKYTPRPNSQKNGLNLGEYITFCNTVKEGLGEFPANEVVARYYSTDNVEVGKLKWRAINGKKLDYFTSPKSQPGMYERVVELLGPNRIGA